MEELDIAKIHADVLAAKLKELGLKSFEDLNDEQVAEVMNAQNKAASVAINTMVEKAVDEANSATRKEMFEAIKAATEESKAERQKQEAVIAALGVKMANGSGVPTKESEADKEAKNFFEDVRNAVKSGEKGEFTIKADTLTTSAANFTRGVEDPTITRLAHRKLTMWDAIPSKPNVPPNAGGTYRYWDQDSGTSVRAAAQVAEGGLAPESTIAWVKRSTNLKKTADNLPYSDEFEYDFRDFMPELLNFLSTNVDIIVDGQIINGDGTGENYDGIVASIPAYTPVASGITDANIFDLACKVSEDITDTEGSKYQPNLVVMNSSDIVSINYLLKKDANNNYMSLEARMAAKGFVVLENNGLAANTMIVGDNRYIHLPNDGMIRVKTNITVGDESLEGIERVKVERRANLLIKNLELTGWRKVTSISAALTTLAT